MKPGLLWARVVAFLCAGLIAFAVAGCGGDDDSSGNNSPTGTGGQTQTQEGIDEPADRKAIAVFLQKFIKSTKSGDADTFCSLFEPGEREEAFGSVEECATYFGPLLKQSEVKGQFEISNLQFDGNQATVTFKDGKGEGILVKSDGQWYIQIPDELAQQVQASQE